MTRVAVNSLITAAKNSRDCFQVSVVQCNGEYDLALLVRSGITPNEAIVCVDHDKSFNYCNK